MDLEYTCHACRYSSDIPGTELMVRCEHGPRTGSDGVSASFVTYWYDWCPDFERRDDARMVKRVERRESRC